MCEIERVSERERVRGDCVCVVIREIVSAVEREREREREREKLSV